MFMVKTGKLLWKDHGFKLPYLNELQSVWLIVPICGTITGYYFWKLFNELLPAIAYFAVFIVILGWYRWITYSKWKPIEVYRKGIKIEGKLIDFNQVRQIHAWQLKGEGGDIFCFNVEVQLKERIIRSKVLHLSEFFNSLDFFEDIGFVGKSDTKFWNFRNDYWYTRKK